VVVANKQVRPLLADVRKVFYAIAISIDLVDLEASPNWSKMGDYIDHSKIAEKEKC